MRVCLSCHATLDDGWRCAACGWDPPEADGVPLLAPEMIGDGHGYDTSWFADLAALEDGNYWFESRNRLLLMIARRHLPTSGRYLEVGCGTGFQLRAFGAAFPGWSCTGSEAQPEGLAFTRSRVGEDVSLLQMDGCRMPFRDEFDVIGAYDVVEHIDDHLGALREMHAALRPGGSALLSVPQHPRLWSKVDELSHHRRRYARGELEAALAVTGFEIVDSRSFNCLLLPVMAATRLLRSNASMGPDDVLDDLRVSAVADTALTAVLGIEHVAGRLGLRFPFGGTRVVLARKRG